MRKASLKVAIGPWSFVWLYRREMVVMGQVVRMVVTKAEDGFVEESHCATHKENSTVCLVTLPGEENLAGTKEFS